jgi:hypothetical protein
MNQRAARTFVLGLHVPFARVSPHDPGVKETVLTLEFAGRAPHTLSLIGAVPARMAMGTALSPPLRDAVPGAVDAIVAALERLHIGVQPRVGPALARDPHSPWWQQADAGRVPSARDR